jgi:Rrf2 family protein
MKLITRSTDYAIRALAYMAGRKDEVISAAELVKALRMPRPFLRRILQKSARAGLIKSYRGSGGGFKLSRTPSSIYVSHVAAAFQGSFNFNECSFVGAICPNIKKCPLKKKIDAIGRRVKSEISSISLSDLLM